MNAKIERMLEMDHKDLIIDLKEEKIDDKEILDVNLKVSNRITIWKGKEYLKGIATKVGLKVEELSGVYPAPHLVFDRIQYKMIVNNL